MAEDLTRLLDPDARRDESPEPAPDHMRSAATALALCVRGEDAATAAQWATRAAAEVPDAATADGEATMRAVATVLTATHADEAPLTAWVRGATAMPARTTAAVHRGALRTATGRITEALSDFEIGLQASQEGSRTDRVLLLAGLVSCRLARGERDLADDLTRRLNPAPGPAAPTRGLPAARLQMTVAELAAAHGHHERAADLAQRAGRLLEDAGTPFPTLLGWRVLAALSLTQVGQRAEAARLAHDYRDAADRFGVPASRALALRTLAAVDPKCGRIDLLREGLALSRAGGVARLEAQIGTDLAEALALDGRLATGEGRAEPVALLRRAETYATAESLRPLLGRIHRLLDQLGAPAPRRRTIGVEALTAAELRVADLAASGLSNRQISHRLFVTVKAVEWHLSNVYRKLGIRTRRALPAHLIVGDAAVTPRR